jgi:peptidoglycan/LPS O-acetylase OafA/YrhL
MAVLWVVIFHYVTVRTEGFADPLVMWIDTISVPRIIVRNGFLGVDLFFLITGFLLTLPWFKHALQGRGRPSAREFYIRRARRILPAYYVQLALLFFVFLPLLNPTLWSTARGFVLANLGLHTLFLHYSTPYSSASLSINGPLWTLALEMQYYLLLPLIAIWFLRAPSIAAAAFLAVSVLWKHSQRTICNRSFRFTPRSARAGTYPKPTCGNWPRRSCPHTSGTSQWASYAVAHG